MTEQSSVQHIRLRWPDIVVLAHQPVWLLYEIDKAADAVLRTVEIYADGRILRNSIELEERDGGYCPSLIGDSAEEGFAGTDPEVLTKEEFDRFWDDGADWPVWFPQ